MSQAMAESALDSASYSVLSYYNKLIGQIGGKGAGDLGGIGVGGTKLEIVAVKAFP